MMLLKSYEWKMIKDLMNDLCVRNEVIDKINKEQEYYIARNIIIDAYDNKYMNNKEWLSMRNSNIILSKGIKLDKSYNNCLTLSSDELLEVLRSDAHYITSASDFSFYIIKKKLIHSRKSRIW